MNAASRRKILIVDDHAQLRELLRLSLSSLEAEFFEAASADNALAVVRDVKPDLIVLDVQLAGEVDGFAVCRDIKSHPALAHIPVIIVTTKSTARDIETVEAVSADAYLTKPFSPKDLLLTAERLLPESDPC